MSADLTSRITAYLSGGGLFNPELANHDAVRDLLIDCRAALAASGDSKVVPLEPTEAMLMAGYYPNFEMAKRREMYQAMLAAAPVSAPPEARTIPDTEPAQHTLICPECGQDRLKGPCRTAGRVVCPMVGVPYMNSGTQT
jgi:hypothetical protein